MIINSLSPTSKSQCFSLALTGELEIFYGNAPQRVKSTLKHDGQLQKTILYYSDYEIEKTINEPQRNLHYIIAPTGIAAIVEKKENLNYPVIYNTFTDYLGSLTHVVESGTLVDEISYEAWGRKRNPANIEEFEEDMTEPPTHIFSRGYTFHEHLNEFKLINMNARLYDPTLGRMLSPDNFVTDVSNSQDYNSYSYARNNPLKFTDPTGNLVQISQNVGWDDVDYSNPNWIDSEAKNVREMYFGDLRRGSSFTIIRSAVTGNESFVSTGGWIDASVLESASAVIIGDIEYSLNIDMKYNSFNVPNEAFGSFNRAGSSNGYMNHGGAASISTEYSFVAQGNGGTNWSEVGNGAMTFAGGAMATVGGVAAGLTGVGTPLGVSLAISTGIPTMGLGTAMMINGFRGVNKSLPGGVAETVDRSMGGNGTAGQLIDIGLGGIPKTLTEALMTGYSLINSNFGQMLLSPSPSGLNYNTPFAPIDNTRVVLPIIR